MKKPKTITQIIVCDLLILPLQKNRGETTRGEWESGRNDSGGERDSRRNDPD
jgi:hypothetical protein